MTKRKSSPKQNVKKRPDVLTLIVMVPFFSCVMGCAGALLVAILFSLFTLDINATQLGAGVLIQGLIDNIFIAISKTLIFGSPIACLIGIATAYSDKKKRNEDKWNIADWVLTAILPFIISLIVIAVILYLVMALYCIFLSAMTVNLLGAYIGLALGIIFGVIAAIIVEGKEHSPKKRQKQKVSKGASPHDLDWWAAKTDDVDIDGD